MIATEKLPVPPIRGGAIQTYIANVAPRLVQSGIDLTVLGVNDPELPNDEVRDGVRYVRVEGGTLDRYQESVTSFLATERFDRIHLFNRPRLVLPVAAAAPGSRISLSLHNEMFLTSKIDPTEAKAAIAAVDRIATVSNFIGKGISDPYPEAAAKLRTIYSGVDAGQFVPGWTSNGKTMRNRLRQEHDLWGRQVVLFVGRLSPKKGADILLRAMEIVAQSAPDAALVLVGSKWYGADEVTDYVAYLQHMAARSPVPVVATGFITPDQVNQWFAVGDLFVCPSIWQEPLARVHYEAMAAGLPIITTRRGGNPEVVEGTGVGLVVDEPESPEAMAKAILTLLRSQSKRESMGQAGRRLALERFNWDRVAGEIGALWAEAAVEQSVPVQQGVGESPAATDAAETQAGGSSATSDGGSERQSSSKRKSSSKDKSGSSDESGSNGESGSKDRSSSKRKSSSKRGSSSKRNDKRYGRSGSGSGSGSSSGWRRKVRSYEELEGDYPFSRSDFPDSWVDQPFHHRGRTPASARHQAPSGYPGNYTSQSITVSVRARPLPPQRPE